jgi:hypothetical protein
VLHHAEDPIDILKEALRLASTVVVIEPNGYNPFLKLIEKYSRYHIDHKERSFLPIKLRQWTKETGGSICSYRFIGFVPFFCPNWLAKILKVLEPIIESIPFVNFLSCATYIFVIKRSK